METDTQSEQRVRFRDFELDLLTRELHRNGERLKLHGHPIDVLIILLERPGSVITREELRKRLWPKDTFVDFEQILNNSVGKLRDALGDKAESPHFIETLPRMGYRFIGSIGGSGVGADHLVPVKLATPSDPAMATTDPVRQSTAFKRWIIWTAIGLACALCALGYWYIHILLPPLRVTEYTQITLDYRGKTPVGTDGSRLYLNLVYQPYAPSQVAVSGGAVTPYPVALPSPFLRDVSSDGSSLLVTSEDDSRRRSLWSVQTAGGTSRRLRSLDGVLLTSASWSPDGKLVAYCTLDGKIYVMRSDGTESHKLIDAPGHSGQYAGDFSSVGDVRWSPDGSRIRFTWNHKLWEVSSSGSGLHPLLPDWHTSEWQCCGSWTPDGRFFVFLLSEPLVSHTPSTIPAGRIWALARIIREGMSSRRLGRYEIAEASLAA